MLVHVHRIFRTLTGRSNEESPLNGRLNIDQLTNRSPPSVPRLKRSCKTPSCEVASSLKLQDLQPLGVWATSQIVWKLGQGISLRRGTLPVLFNCTLRSPRGVSSITAPVMP